MTRKEMLMKRVITKSNPSTFEIDSRYIVALSVKDFETMKSGHSVHIMMD
jgi:hypothetical protein